MRGKRAKYLRRLTLKRFGNKDFDKNYKMLKKAWNLYRSL